MPNWTSNRIRIVGNEPGIREFLDAVRSENQLFDFNRLIPMPALLRNTQTGRAMIDGREVTSWYEDADTGKTRVFTAAEEAALRDIGYSNWYEWSIANWGTKWNALHVAVRASAISRGLAEVAFDTAWSAPEPLYRKMIKRFSRLDFTCLWRDEGDACYCALRSGDIEGL